MAERLDVFPAPVSRVMPERKGAIRLKVCLASLLGIGLAGCNNPDWQGKNWNRNFQDSFEIPSSTRAQLMPDNAGAGYVPSTDGRPDSPLAYRSPASPSYEDRPLEENIAGSSELADYIHAIRSVGLLPWISGDGPYTVFAIPNGAMERLSARWTGGLMAPQYRGQLTHILGYTIARGAWTDAKLRRVIGRNHGHAIGLKTLYGDLLGVSVSPRTGDILLTNGAGDVSRVQRKSFMQSNGVLYFTYDAMVPPPTSPTRSRTAKH